MPTNSNLEKQASPIWAHVESIPSFEPVPGVSMRSMAGDRIMLNFVTLAPNAVVPNHAHENEQAGTVLRGRLTLVIGSETRTLSPGEAFLIPANVEHQASTDGDGCEVLDIFSPPREDYRRT